MLDLKLLREQEAELTAAIRRKAPDFDPAGVLAADALRRELLTKYNDLRAQQNAANDAIAAASGPEKQEKITAMKAVAEQVQQLQAELGAAEAKVTELTLQIPNPPLPMVPNGRDDSENPIVEFSGEPTKFDFEPRDHVALGELTDTIELKAATERTSGARFYFLKNELPLLEYALQAWAWRKLIQHGFIPLTTPMMIRGEAFARARKVPGGVERIEQGSEFFRLADDPLYLIGTAEHITLNMHAGETIPESKLPLRYAAWSSCFRREAGAAGRDTRGILRVHQFEKMEMLAFTTPEKSEEEHAFLISLQKEFFRELGIPFRVVEACTGDMGFSDARQFDVEAWMPGQAKYREVTSGSNCRDFQARALGVKVARENGTKEVAHTLNATGISMARALIAIMENYQQADGSILIPDVLKPFMPAGIERIPVRR